MVTRARLLGVLAGWLIVHPSSLTAQTSVSAFFWPQQQIVTLPVSGVIKKSPAPGSKAPFVADSFDPASFTNPYVTPNFSHTEDRDLLTFESSRLSAPRVQLGAEHSQLVDQLTNLRNRLGSRFSEAPVLDPLAVDQVGPSQSDRIATARAQILAVFPPDAVKAALPADIADGFPAQPLEDRVRAALNPRALDFLAASLALDLSDLTRAASGVVAQAIRREAGLDRYTIQNPTAPFQRVHVNDPILYDSGDTRLPLPILDEVITQYCLGATGYWQNLVQSGLYSRDDYAVLAKWRIRGGNAFLVPNTRTPVEQIQYECSNWASDLNRFQRDIRILREITYRTTEYFLLGWPNPALSIEQRSDQLAYTVVANLGLDASAAEGHRLDAQYALRLIPQYIFAALGNKRAGDFGFDAQSFASEVASVVAPLVADRLAGGQWELRARGIMGGLTVLPSKIEITTPLGYQIGDLAPVQTVVDIDYAEPGTIFATALANPAVAGDVQLALDDWRRRSDAGLTRRREGFKEQFRLFTEEVWKHYRDRAEWLQEGLRIVERLRDLSSALRAVNAPFGHDDLAFRDEGRIPLPPNTTVVARHALPGEFGQAQRALATMESHLRRNARLFVTSTQLAQLGATTGSVYRLELDPPVQPPADVLLAGVVHGVGPTRADEWAIELEVFPAIRSTSLLPAGMPGVAQILPLEDRYCLTGGALLTPNACADAAALLPRQGRRNIRVRERLQ